MSREIVLAIDVAAEADAITDAITTQEGLSGFWTSDVSAAPEVGAELRFGFEPAPVDLQMTLDAHERGKRVAWTPGDAWPHWRGTAITWSFAASPVDGATRVVLVHDGWPDDYPDAELGAVAHTWSLVIGALKGYAETGQSQPALG